MKTRSGEKIKMATLEELLGVPGEESASEVEISRIHSFKDHPFKVIDDDKMDDLVDSIRRNGVLTPVILRQEGLNDYEMISGHRRLHAAKLAGLSSIPAFIRDMTDDESTIDEAINKILKLKDIEKKNDDINFGISWFYEKKKKEIKESF